MAETKQEFEEIVLTKGQPYKPPLFKNKVLNITSNKVISFSGYSGVGKTAMLIYLASNLIKKAKCLFLETEGKIDNLMFHLNTYDLFDKLEIKRITQKFESEIERFEPLETKIKEGYNVIMIDSVTNLFQTKTKATAKAIKLFMKYLRELSNKHNVTFLTTHWCYTSMNHNYNICINGEQGVRYSSDDVFLIRGVRAHSRIHKRVIKNLTKSWEYSFGFDKNNNKIVFD